MVGTYRGGLSDVTPPNRLPNLQLVQCDLRDCLRVKQLFDKSTFSHVFHLGAQSLPVLSWKDPVTTFESNIMGSLKPVRSNSSNQWMPSAVALYRLARALSTATYRVGGYARHGKPPSKPRASLRHQQDVRGSAGPGVFAELPHTDGHDSAVQYHRAR